MDLNRFHKKKYHLVGTIPQYNRKVVVPEVISISLTHKYMTAHFPSMGQALQ